MAKTGFLEHLHPPAMPEERVRFYSTFCLGGITFLLFLVLGATGVVLMFSYVPTATGAAEFFATEAGDLPFAWYMRRLHFLAGQAMVITLLLHVLRVLLAKAYLPPRAGNWLVGLALLGLTLALDLSGYVLRWDAATQAAATVVAGVMAQVPLLGPLFERLVLGGPQLSEATLLRFYVLHCLALPALSLVLCMFHFWRIRKDGKQTSGL